MKQGCGWIIRGLGIRNKKGFREETGGRKCGGSAVMGEYSAAWKGRPWVGEGRGPLTALALTPTRIRGPEGTWDGGLNRAIGVLRWSSSVHSLSPHL